MNDILYKYPGFPIWMKHVWIAFFLGMLFGLPHTTYAKDIKKNTLDFLIYATIETHIFLIGFPANFLARWAVTRVSLDLGRHAVTSVPNLLTTPAHPIVGTTVPPNARHHAMNMKPARVLGLPIIPEILRVFDEPN
jgi:hypothetical protein